MCFTPVSCPADLIGNGACDRDLNIPECSFDGGDCCSATCVNAAFTCGSSGFLCIALGNCSRADVGDGFCDARFNIAECSFDGGDCCQETCVNQSFVCGVVGFNCLDPSVGDDGSGSASLGLGWLLLASLLFSVLQPNLW
eukprot:c9366_g1_i3.p1 GENE.c9366_g1_i3~~c9366_g1_i3.p1  ORF type:complete len:140 (+),score=33.82 c9366_g1_i3:88-507(+)